MNDFETVLHELERYEAGRATDESFRALDRIEAENERLQEQADNHRFLSDKYDEDLGRLEAENERLREERRGFYNTIDRVEAENKRLQEALTAIVVAPREKGIEFVQMIAKRAVRTIKASDIPAGA